MVIIKFTNSLLSQLNNERFPSGKAVSSRAGKAAWLRQYYNEEEARKYTER